MPESFKRSDIAFLHEVTDLTAAEISLQGGVNVGKTHAELFSLLAIEFND
ncbi:MAG: hypothetical protein IJL14_06335 [Selenomonadaceae bacterium]|nr:hypothetical protein [Selenomonadaceae bacterium]